ncbi:MAG TPA: zf-HC2 domain-containing protein [Gemmatimonadales bacterium]|jgi:anti-sigma factor (TIGR02949 family)|nr:zf-HC2 domain-containing protein [Gemmatimonadales bacterium]
MAEEMNCREAVEQLQDYLKRELTPGVATELRRHLDHCRHCFDHARFEENFLRMLEERARKETCPGALRQRILDLLRSEAGPG